MIKRSFTGLSQPKLKYDLLETDPKGPETVSTPSNILLLLNRYKELFFKVLLILPRVLQKVFPVFLQLLCCELLLHKCLLPML